MKQEDLLILAETATGEDEKLDFKSEFRPEQKTAFWAELIKDIVAFANTNGGVIVFGIDDDGSVSSHDCSSLLAFDPAKITDQINKYTGTQFAQFSTTSIVREGRSFPAILVQQSRIPLVFLKVGTYETSGGQQKTAFSKGTVYFRHGAKSEPATQDDIRKSFDRELARVRAEWLDNMRQVVKAAPGSTVIVASPDEPISEVRLTSDPSAPAVTVKALSETHPHRQKEVIDLVRLRLDGIDRFNGHDIKSIKETEKITHDTRPDLVHLPHTNSSPQYSNAFVDFICAKVEENEDYLSECRRYWKEANAAAIDWSKV